MILKTNTPNPNIIIYINQYAFTININKNLLTLQMISLKSGVSCINQNTSFYAKGGYQQNDGFVLKNL